jgi:hypothetical protein
MHDRTGAGVEENDDTIRQWAGYIGYVTTYYGDDGLLVTLVEVYGVNCPEDASALGYDLTGAGTAGQCSFLDVDKQATVSPEVEALLIGSPDDPTGGLKGTARGAWETVRGLL